MIDTSFDMFIETLVPHNELIISRTDLNGIITYVNETFAEISGYTPEELIGKPHNIVRHPDMPKSVYADLWKSLRERELERIRQEPAQRQRLLLGKCPHQRRIQRRRTGRIQVHPRTGRTCHQTGDAKPLR